MRILPCLLAACLVTACAADANDDAASSSALTNLTPGSCAKPDVKTSPHLANGEPVDGTAHTTLSGCILAAQGETGDALVARIAQRLGDTDALSKIRTEKGKPVFTSFVVGPATGTIETGIAQDIDVVLGAAHSPSTKLHTVRTRKADGSFVLEITNATEMQATLLFVPVTVILPGNLSVKLVAKPEANGATLTGVGDVTLEAGKDNANDTAELVRNVFDWLRGEVAPSSASHG